MHEDFYPIWKELAGGLKRQRLTTLQRDIDETACCLSARALIIPMLGLLKLTLALFFHMDHQDDLGTGLHQFGLVQNISAACKVLKTHTEQHQVISGARASPSLSDAAMLTAPDGVSLTVTMSMEQGAHSQLRVVLITLLGQDHPSALSMKDINSELLERDTEL